MATPPTLDGIVTAITDAVAELEPVRSDARALGVGAAGMVDREGVIHYSPNVPAFLEAPVRARLQDALGMPVVVDNDANVAAVGELEHGAARGCRNALVITLGTGVGGGLVCDGRVLRGAHGFAGEIGHFQVDPHGPTCACGERGHWEALSSGTALGSLGRDAWPRGPRRRCSSGRAAIPSRSRAPTSAMPRSPARPTRSPSCASTPRRSPSVSSVW